MALQLVKLPDYGLCASSLTALPEVRAAGIGSSPRDAPQSKPQASPSMPAIRPQMPEASGSKNDNAKLTAPNANAMAPTMVFGLMTMTDIPLVLDCALRLAAYVSVDIANE
jgi:hypothetical protein